MFQPGPFVRILLTLLGIACLIQAAPPKLEKWAGKNLPVIEGLALWLDASVQIAAYKANGKALAYNSDKAPNDMPEFYDGSGHQRHLHQADPQAQPKLVYNGGGVAARFDGVHSSLKMNELESASPPKMMFLVAAPFSRLAQHRTILEIGKEQLFNANWIAVAPDGPLGKFQFHTQSGEYDFKRLILGNRAGPQPRNGFEGDIAEAIFYDRMLDEKEAAAVKAYLTEKYAQANIVMPDRADPVGGHPLRIVQNPPAIKMFVPGFTVHELPIRIPNINNVKYRADGKLVALAYNGDIHLLTDTDGDGIEDKHEFFWESGGKLRGPIGLAVTPENYPLGQGVFVPSKGKCSLIIDTDGDGKADQEIIIARGWSEIFPRVDAVGCAIDPKDGAIYFGLGCANFANAYQTEKDGSAKYDVKSENGTVIRVSPDFKQRRVVATGLRFTIGMAFNTQGDLFCTDQEGATWLANGNPFDELLHIQPGRHYGFPPRHPKYLPGVIDEPSVFNYGPQHQSTCGVNFNVPVNGGPTFGPAWWAGDAIVCGESRGKLWRTKLVKTAAGYVAQNQQIAALSMLTVDACISPKGELVVACHSGAPDWGTGPSGIGKLFKIRYMDHDAPQPLFAYGSSAERIGVTFDRPVDSKFVESLKKPSGIEYGKHVMAGDRFETFRPGYQVVMNQMQSPRFDRIIQGIKSNDKHGVMIDAASHSEQAGHGLILGDYDLGFDLSGVDFHFDSDMSGLINFNWRAWLPHLDFHVSRELTAPSEIHAKHWKSLETPGRLTLRTQLDLYDMLRPAIQAGSRIDYEWPAEIVTVEFQCNVPLKIKMGGQAIVGNAMTVQPKPGHLAPIELELKTGGKPPELSVSWHTSEDPRPRALPLNRMLLPWAKLPASAAPENRAHPPQIAGGDWQRGQAVFFSEQALCGKCHAVGGKGGRIGPDLSNLIFRDYDSVLRDIQQPGAALNPDHITYAVKLKDGRSLVGVVHTIDDQRVLIGDAGGNETIVGKTEIVSSQSLPVSIMPPNLDQLLGAEKFRDLMVFLLTTSSIK